MTESRKRIRSQEEESALQLKYFVNEKIVNLSDAKKMEQVFEKTLNMIFQGAKIQNQNSKDKSGMNDSLVLDVVEDKLPDAKGCKLCWRDTEPDSNFVCKNCNLKVCKNCNVSCVNCNSNLCTNCVNLFECSINDVPVCEDCKYFVN